WRRALCAFTSGVGCTLAMAPYYILPLMILGLCCLFLLLALPADATRPNRTDQGSLTAKYNRVPWPRYSQPRW
ncbi:MAG: hypothetical protein AAFU58_10780, partial [Pseudomonadota bacterium]